MKINFQTIYSRTTQYSNSFLPSVVRDWNSLPCADRDTDTINYFKQSLNQNMVCVPKYCYTGKRKLQILHTRIRTGCSSLNFDLYSKNIVDSPLCTCGSGNIENADHFFLRCPLYINQRTELTNSILFYTTMTLNVLLSGTNHYLTIRMWQYLTASKNIYWQQTNLIVIELGKNL